MIKDQVDYLMDILTPEENMIICMRYGLNCHKKYTLKETGVKCNLTFERIRQLQKESLRKMKDYAEGTEPIKKVYKRNKLFFDKAS